MAKAQLQLIGSMKDAPDRTPTGSVAAYMGPEEGPFRCDHCEYFDDGQCSKPEVIQQHGPTVEAAGCCNFFETA